MRKEIKAVFLDRDGTLSQNSAPKLAERDRAIGWAVGQPDLRLSNDTVSRIFWLVMEEPGRLPTNTLEREHAFWQRWFQLLLEEHGVTRDSEALAADLYARYPFYHLMELYPETILVLDALKARGYLLGVISDTFPSLELSLRSLGIADYFQSFTASAVVGAQKPDPRIFQAALCALGVAAEEALFVDDTLVESDGARVLGFTAFHLDRQRQEPDYVRWEIGRLTHMLAWLERA